MYILVYITAPELKVAQEIAELLLKRRLIACANIYQNINSLYWWQGEIQKDKEVILICKSKSEFFNKISELVTQNHPYSCPCIISIPISDGYLAFLKWIDDELLNQ